jgi:hypothetical protein
MASHLEHRKHAARDREPAVRAATTASRERPVRTSSWPVLGYDMRATGQIGAYHWAERSGETLLLRDVVAGLGNHIKGLLAVNVSWDSGALQDVTELPVGWHLRGGRATSPPIDDQVLAVWPQSPCCEGQWDEWYFFRTPPDTVEASAFCNYGGMSLADHESLVFPGGLNLAEQLERLRPDLVIGEGGSLFVLAKDEAVIATFLALAREPKNSAAR